jgi:hypothetical protein
MNDRGQRNAMNRGAQRSVRVERSEAKKNRGAQRSVRAERSGAEMMT